MSSQQDKTSKKHLEKSKEEYGEIGRSQPLNNDVKRETSDNFGSKKTVIKQSRHVEEKNVHSTLQSSSIASFNDTAPMPFYNTYNPDQTFLSQTRSPFSSIRQQGNHQSFINSYFMNEWHGYRRPQLQQGSDSSSHEFSKQYTSPSIMLKQNSTTSSASGRKKLSLNRKGAEHKEIFDSPQSLILCQYPGGSSLEIVTPEKSIARKRPHSSLSTSMQIMKRPFDDAFGETEFTLQGAKRNKKYDLQAVQNFEMLGVLCDASIQMKDKLESGISCRCPRSRCIKLYCECFQAGLKCSKGICSCRACLNTDEESGPDGERTRAIENILSRNPHAFVRKKSFQEDKKIAGVICRCVKSQCLKLYCECFQRGYICCAQCKCINCLNTEAESGEGGRIELAREICLSRKPNAFHPKEKKGGCACKINRCLKKYCECFQARRPCSEKCSCIGCENLDMKNMRAHNEQKKHIEK